MTWRRPVAAAEAARLYRLGLTIGEVAGVCGVSEWVIGSRLDEAEVTRRAPGNRDDLPLVRAGEAYRAGSARLRELAAVLSIPADVIMGRASRPARRADGRARADVPAREVADLYRAGWTVARIAVASGVTGSTVLRRLAAAGVGRRPKSMPASFPADEAARKVTQDGVSFAGLAREYGVSVYAVTSQMAARNVAAAVHAPRMLRTVAAADIAVLYQAGLSVAQIAGQYGVSRWTITSRLDQAGTPRRASARAVFPVTEAAGLYRAGASLSVLAARYETNPPQVWRKLTAAGVVMRPPGGQRISIPVSEAAGLYEAGATMAELAARYGVCETVIYNRLTEAGAAIRHNKGNFKPADAGLMAALARQIGLERLP